MTAMNASILKMKNTVNYSRVQDLEEDVQCAKYLFERNAHLKEECMIAFKSIEELASKFDF